jgi:hypothetical protein
VSGHVLVYDSGMLIALVDRKPKALAIHAQAASTRHRPVLIGPVLAQVWRQEPASIHRLTGILRDCTVVQARGSQPAMRAPEHAGVTVQCVPCAAGFTLADYKRVGQMLGSARIPDKKRPDPVDAMVVLIGAHHQRAVVCTSDPHDIKAYAGTLKGPDLVIAQV